MLTLGAVALISQLRGSSNTSPSAEDTSSPPAEARIPDNQKSPGAEVRIPESGKTPLEAAMPFLKKFADKVWSSMEDAVDSIGDSFVGYLTSKYPDIDEVFEVLSEMRSTYNQSGEEGETDDKWRPMILNLGLLYKLQRIHDSSCGSW